MPQFSRDSIFRLRTCAEPLQRLFQRVVALYDCRITEGHRGKEAQDRAFAEGRSRLRWPSGNHNAYPSRAADAYPFPVEIGGPVVVDGKLHPGNLRALLRFYHFAGYVQGLGEGIGVPIRWGGDWDGDFDFSDQSFNDLVHFELKEEKN